MRAQIAALAILAATPAMAQQYPNRADGAPSRELTEQGGSAPAPRPVRGVCGPDGLCDEFQILKRERVAGPPQATLFRIETRSWTAASRAEGGRTQVSYVLCSPEKPAFITPAKDGEGYTAIYLAPLTPVEYETSLDGYVVYFEACHGRGKDIAEGRAHLADKLGYTALAEYAQPIRISRPEDILSGVWDDVTTGSIGPASVRQ